MTQTPDDSRSTFVVENTSDEVAAADLAEPGGESLQCAFAFGQRVTKGQPVGGWTGLGISPSRISKWSAARLNLGVERISAWLYGWLGWPKKSSASHTSMIRPRYITATRSAT